MIRNAILAFLSKNERTHLFTTIVIDDFQLKELVRLFCAGYDIAQKDNEILLIRNGNSKRI